MELIDQLFLALRDLRNEVDDMSKRVGWTGHGARARADSAINEYLSRSASSGSMIPDSEIAPVADNNGGASLAERDAALAEAFGIKPNDPLPPLRIKQDSDDNFERARQQGIAICCAADSSQDCAFGKDDPRCFYYESETVSDAIHPHGSSCDCILCRVLRIS